MAEIFLDSYTLAMQLYRERVDKKWGLTDCVSFAAMREGGITEALTTESSTNP